MLRTAAPTRSWRGVAVGVGVAVGWGAVAPLVAVAVGVTVGVEPGVAVVVGVAPGPTGPRSAGTQSSRGTSASSVSGPN